MQTPKEVIVSLIRRRSADRVGLFDSLWQDTLRKWTAQGYPTDDQGKPVRSR